MNKVFSAVAASVFSIGAISANAEGRTQPLRPIEEYIFQPDKTENDNCGFMIPLEYPQSEYDRRMAEGQDIDPRLSYNHHYLYLRNDDLPRVVVDEKNYLIDIFLSTASIEGQELAVSRVERNDDTITIDGSLLSEHLINIDANNGIITLTNIITGDSDSVNLTNLPKTSLSPHYPNIAAWHTKIGDFDLNVEPDYIEIATPLEFDGDIPNTSLRVFFRKDGIHIQYLDEIKTDAEPHIVSIPGLPLWVNEPDILCKRDVPLNFDNSSLAITPRFD